MSADLSAQRHPIPSTASTGQRDRLAAALAAATRGWPVIPLRPRMKTPAVTDWQDAATVDPAAIRRWWRGADPNLGIVCGPARLLVVDLDAPHGTVPPDPWRGRGVEHGRDVLAWLAQQHGHPYPDGTYTVATPTGGEHLYFTLPPDVEPVGSSVGRLGWHVDTRGAGGYVVGAGSVLDVGGRLRPYRVVRDGPAVPLPGWLYVLLAPAAPEPAGGTGVGVLTAYVRGAVQAEARRVREARTGGRNHALFVAAAHLGELVGAEALDEEHATAALLDAARRHVGVDGFTAAEARRAVGNGIDRGRGTPRALQPE